MRRILPTVWPTVRITRGKSFGGMTAQGDDADDQKLADVNIEHEQARPDGRPGDRAARPPESAPLSSPWRVSRPSACRSTSTAPPRFSIERGRRRGRGFRLVVLRHALLEGFDALGDVAHDVGNLALAAEQQQRDRSEQHPVPDAKATHDRHPRLARAGPTRALARNLSAPARQKQARRRCSRRAPAADPAARGLVSRCAGSNLP